jgi:hypothetical protein
MLAIVDQTGAPLNKAQAAPKEEVSVGEATMQELIKLAEREARKASTHPVKD